MGDRARVPRPGIAHAAGAISAAFSALRLWSATCMVMGMILLITVSARAVECASALRESTSEDVEWANGLQHAIAALRKQDFSAVILDEAVLELDSDGGDVLLRHCGTAVPIFVNLAISGQQRLVREVRTALRRRAEDEARARQAAEAE